MENVTVARDLDQFYTNKPVVHDCLKFFKRVTNLRSPFFVEPSAGAGAFFDELPRKSRLGLDLAPKHQEVITQDFLLFEGSSLSKNRKIVAIGNPPFGKNSSLALKFINKASAFADFVAFILPKTFKKSSIVNKIDRNLVLVAELDLPGHSFNFNGKPYDVPCVFQVWKRTRKQRTLITEPKAHPDFNFVTPHLADFAIRRVGGLAGKVLGEFGGYSPSSHYYIKAIDNADGCRAVFESIDWSGVKFNTAGNPSISKTEVVSLYGSCKPNLSCARINANTGKLA